MNGPRFHPTTWPMIVKVPLMTVVLMVAVAVVISHVVLQRLASDQESSLKLVTDVYLSGLSAAVLPHVIRRDVWESFDVLDHSRHPNLTARHTIVTLADGSVLAASDPGAFPTGSRLSTEVGRHFVDGRIFAIDSKSGLAWARKALQQEGIDLGAIVAAIDIGNLLAVRREVLLTLILVNGGLTIFFGAVGYFLVRRTVHPISLLTEYVERVRDGALDPIPIERFRDKRTEFGRLFDSFNAMAAALRERETLATRLAKEESSSTLGRLASGMAHEVNNPLGGMLTVVDTLRKHGHDSAVRERCLNLLDRGLRGIAGVVRSMLATYKGSVEPSRLDGRDLDDLKFLLQHEVSRRRIRLSWDNRLDGISPTDGAAIRQIALNLLLNACAASELEGDVAFEAWNESNAIRIRISDRGPGLPGEVRHLFLHPDHAAGVPSDDVGLGVWTICHLLRRLSGHIDISDTAGGGTTIVVTVPLSTEERFHAVA